MRLIDADTLKQKAFGKRSGLIHTSDIDAMPTIEPQRKHGKWRHYEGMIECSECKTEIYDDIMELLGDDLPKFCPDCGADMRGEKRVNN